MAVVCTVCLFSSPTVPKSARQLKEECALMIDRFDYASLPEKATELIAAGEREKKPLMTGYGYAYLGGAQLFNGDVAQTHEVLNRSIVIGEQTANDTLLSIAYNTLGIYEASVERNLHLAQRYFLKSRRHARDARYDRIEKSIGSNLAEIAIELNDTAGIVYARECYDYGVSEKNPRFEYSGAMNLAELYKIKGDYNLATRYAAVAMYLAEQYGYHDIGQINLIRSAIAMATGHLDEAEIYAREAIKMTASENTLALPKAYLMLATVLRARGNYRESLKQLETGADMAHKYSSFSSIADIYELMADNYESLGQSAEALKYLRFAKDSTESHYNTERKRLDNERSLILDLEENENRMKMQTVKVKAQKNLLILLSVVIVLLIVILVMVIVTHYKKKQLYASIVSQNIKRVELRDELDDSLSATEAEEDLPVTESDANVSNISTAVADSNLDDRTKSSVSEEKARTIYAELCRLMKEERLYADSRITRETIIDRLGTNRTYFTQIISRYGWDNYSQFVNSFRVDEAIRILSDRTRTDLKISELYAELGFGSPTTFYKIFSTATGVSPAVFRKSLK